MPRGTFERYIMENAMIKGKYDLNSAVTFFLAGLGVGAVLVLAFNPKMEPRVG
jgi:hypothetical protein